MLANGWSFVTSNFSATDIVDKMERQNPMKNNVSLSYSHHCCCIIGSTNPCRITRKQNVVSNETNEVCTYVH